MGWDKPSRPANFEAKTSTNKESDRWLSRKRLPARPQVEKKTSNMKIHENETNQIQNDSPFDSPQPAHILAVKACDAFSGIFSA